LKAWWVATLVAAVAGSVGTVSTARGEPINLNRFAFGLDVPESPGLMVLGDAGFPVVRGSAPKPISLSTVGEMHPDGLDPIVSLDFAPYFLLGGGIRDLASYRANSLAGRLTRVLTKTTLSLAVRSRGSGSTLGLAIRATFHDPHDAVLNSALPESAMAALRAAGIEDVDPAVEDLSDSGVDLDPVFADARRSMRGRKGMQISGGLGQAMDLRGGSLSADSTENQLNMVWLTSQITLDGRMDFLVTAQTRNLSDRDGEVWLGLGLLRKTNAADLTVAGYYDTDARRIHPHLQADIRAFSRAQIVGWFSSVSDGDARSRLFAGLGLKWYVAYDSE
jgi:hypothetical protein